MNKIRRHMSYANVMSTIAAFAALTTGSAYAVTTFTGANIKDGTLTGRDLKNGSVGTADVAGLTGADIADGKLTGKDLAASTVSGNHIANGSVSGLDVAYNAITGAHIPAGSIGGSDLADGSVDSGAIANDSIGLGDLAPATRNALSIQVVKQSVSMVPDDLATSYGQPRDVDILCPNGGRAVGGGAYSEYWIGWAADNPAYSSIGGIASKPTAWPILDGNDQSVGWHLRVSTYPRAYGAWVQTETGPEPTPPFAASEFDPVTAYALCAA